MTWNYRVMRKAPTAEGEPYGYGIYEVYYDENGFVTNWTEDHVEITIDYRNEEEFRTRVSEALSQPILDHVTGRPAHD